VTVLSNAEEHIQSCTVSMRSIGLMLLKKLKSQLLCRSEGMKFTTSVYRL